MEIDVRLLPLKLRVPSPRPNGVPRPRLMARLDELWQPDKRLALVCAPAGYGKTSLIAGWAAQRPPAEGPGLAWLALDPADNHPPHFWLGLVEALKSALTPGQYEACRAAGEALEGSSADAVQAVTARLVQAVSDWPGRLVLVLDDYQDLTHPAGHACVKQLLASLPPRLRLLIATRVDPPLGLAQLRARNQLVEIRTADLQFSLGETAEFLNRTFGLALTAEQCATLAERTEGWAAGLQLAGLSLQGRADPAPFIQAFGGSQRFILEYLIDEVLERQPRAVQDFLLRTSVYERFCAEACEAVLEQPPASPVTLAALERMNLFLVPLDEDGRWYRYHRLFASLLRSRLRQALDPAAQNELYRRASQWYERQGLLPEAIALALRAPDQTYAADLLEREVLTFFYHSELAQVQAWLDRLAPPLITQRALLGAVKAAVIALRPPYYPQSLPAAEEWMQAAERALPADPARGDVARAFIYSIRSFWARFRGEPSAAVLALIESALALLPDEPNAPAERSHRRIRSGLETNLGFAHWEAGNEAAARQAFAQARRDSRLSDDLFNESAAANMLVGLSSLHGELGAAARLAREALAYFDSQGAQLGRRAPYSGEIGMQLAEILIEWNALAEAEARLTENLELAQWTMGQNILLHGRLALARLAAARGQLAAAGEQLAAAEQLSGEGAALAGAQRARLWLAARGGRPEALDRARQWARQHTLAEFGPGPSQPDWAVALMVARLRAMDETAARGRAELLAWLARQQQAMQARGWAHWEIQLAIAEALARRGWGEGPGARAAARRALELGAPGGYVRMFVDEGEPLRALLAELDDVPGWLAPYRQQVLAAFPAPLAHMAGEPAALVEPLTPREGEVLKLICQGLSNQAIAEKLVVTLSTVKKHNNSLFGKLGVANRAQAIVRSRQLGLSR